MTRIRVLGPVRLETDGGVVEVGPPQRSVVAAALAVDAGRLVSRETLLDRVWGPSHPRTAWRTVQTHVAIIRELFRRTGTPLVYRHGGYLLDLDPDLVDVHRARRLAGQGADPGRSAADRLAAWRAAMALWTGEPLAGLTGDWVDRTRETWCGEHREAGLGWAHAEIEAGNPTGTLDLLDQLIIRYPLAEALPTARMRALYAAGRRAEALECYAAARQRLDDELAERPGPQLQAVYQAVLRRDPVLPPPSGTLPVTEAPAQLPADVRGFAGRVDELAWLDAIAATVGRESTAVVISAVTGSAGVGKTALVLHWAHGASKLFPDGQLYVNLRGYDRDGSMVDPADAVRGFLDALAVPATRMPADRDAQAALYRTLLADKRMLIVLDNAHDTTQVRPLLPGAPGCLVLVTSRNRLTHLVAATGAHTRSLDLLTGTEARELLVGRLGEQRVGSSPEAVETLITQCARLPLALAIVAARAATQPWLPLDVLAGELADARTRLDVLAGTDAPTSLRAVFSWSYLALRPPAARLFRLLGLHPGPDTTVPAAASLAGLPTTEVRGLLAELTHSHLVAEHLPGRYTMHDLLRAYATELVHQVDSTAERGAAARRILDHYLHTGYAAGRLLNPHRDQITLAAPEPGATPHRLDTAGQALAWYTSEHAVLLAAVQQAAAAVCDARAWRLAWTLVGFLDLRGHWRDWIRAGETALTSATRLADRDAQARTSLYLGSAYTRVGQRHHAESHLAASLRLYREGGDLAGQAHAHRGYAVLHAQHADHTGALRHARQALDLYTAAGDDWGRGRTLNSIGWNLAQLGDPRTGAAHCRQALTILARLDDPDGCGATWDSLGYCEHLLGRYTQAVTCYQNATTFWRRVGDLHALAETLSRLGETHHAAGEADAARGAWRQALAILDDLQHPDAERLRQRTGGPIIG